MRRGGIMLALLAVGMAVPAGAASDRFVAFNMTATTDITGLYLAPAGTESWGPNQVLNDPDKVLEHGERLKLTGIKHQRYDARIVFAKGKTCVKHGIDLTRDPTFDIRDADLAACK
jgi:hypothetical protein